MMNPTKITVRKPEPQPEGSQGKALRELVQFTLADMPTKLPAGASLPASYKALEAALEANDDSDAANSKLYCLLYEITIDMELGFDRAADGSVSPCARVFSAASASDPTVRRKVTALYGHGVQLQAKCGELTSNALQDVVLRKLASPLGMDGPAFDRWCLDTE